MLYSGQAARLCLLSTAQLLVEEALFHPAVFLQLRSQRLSLHPWMFDSASDQVPQDDHFDLMPMKASLGETRALEYQHSDDSKVYVLFCCLDIPSAAPACHSDRLPLCPPESKSSFQLGCSVYLLETDSTLVRITFATRFVVLR